MKKEKKKKRFDGSKYINLEPSLNERIVDTVVISFGRFSPPTIGHQKLVDKIKTEAKMRKAKAMVFTSHSFDSKKNPLPYESKISYLQAAFGSIVQKSKARTIIEVAKELSGRYDNLVVVVGSDRVAEFQRLLNTYNGKDFTFENIEVISAGERDPDADDVSGMSASKLRSLATEGDYQTFVKGLPQRLRPRGKELYDELRLNMNVNEDFDDETLEERAPLSIAQRRQRGRTMRRYKNKIALARKRAERRKASPEKLKVRARRKARDLLRSRFLQGKKYSEITPSEKIQIDKKILRVPDAVVNRIVTRQLPKVRRAEMERLAAARATGPKNESLDEAFESFFLETEDKTKHRYHTDLAPSTAEKRQAHFNKGAEKHWDDPSAYDPAPGDARAETKPSKYTKRYHKLFTKEGSVKHDRRFKFYRQKHNPHFNDLDESSDAALEKKASETGVSKSILKQVYSRGVAAWRTGHRPGTTPEQWGMARVNSFLTGGKTQKTTDADLWKKHKGITEDFLDEAKSLMEAVERFTERNKKDPKNREYGTDSLVKILKGDTPGQKHEAYFDTDIESSFGDFRKGSRVRFDCHSLDMTDDTEKEGTVVGSNTQHLRVRSDDGKLYLVRHKDAEIVEETMEISEDFLNFDVLTENLLDKAVEAVRKHVAKGKTLEDVIWEFSAATGFKIPTKELYNQYIKLHGKPLTREPVSAERRNALIRKYT
jgi:nicotinic acid mononucleotide adenylyltransferase